MANRMTALPTRLVDAWAPGLALADPLAAGRLHRVASYGVGAMALVPAGLCLAVSPAVALPVGVGTVAALMLGAAAFLSGERRIHSAVSAQSDETTLERLGEDPMLDLMPGLITVHNARGLVLSIRGRDRKALSEDLAPLEAKGLLDQIHVSDRITFLQAVDSLRQGEAGATVTLRLEKRRPDEEMQSQFVHRRLMLSAIADDEAAFAGFLCQMFDNGGEEAMKRTLADKAAEAHSANEAKTRFLAAVSHELRTPLNAILGFSEILAGEYFGKLENDRQREYVALINQSGNHLLGVVNTMLDMSKIEAGRYELICEQFAATEAAGACEAMLSLQAKNKGVTLTSRVSRDVGEIVADRRALQQVLINIVGNAVKFTEEGGVVALDVDRKGQDIVFTVSDTGIGIPADRIAELGRPFVQVQSDYARKYEGTGLGLSLVKGLVALHGGRVEIASRLGEGTVVSIILPAAGPEVDAQDHARPSNVAGRDTTEFPPRLPVAVTSMNEKKESTHDNAKAQTA